MSFDSVTALVRCVGMVDIVPPKKGLEKSQAKNHRAKKSKSHRVVRFPPPDGFSET
jgi:hypothetical protein